MRFLALIIAILSCLTPALGGEAFPFDIEVDFAILHPEMLTPAYRHWRESNGFGNWREMPPAIDGAQVVIVQGRGEVRAAPIYSAKMRQVGAKPKVVKS